MHAMKYLSLLPILIGLSAAADCYSADPNETATEAARRALSNLSYNNQQRNCVRERVGDGLDCVACYRTGGAPARFYEAVGNIRDQCLNGATAQKQGYWEADGLRVCYDCTNSGNCNGDKMKLRRRGPQWR